MELSLLEERARTCKDCPLHCHRTNIVFGEGPLDASVMLVGEAPGADEDEQGRPFVGRAGTVLGKLLAVAGLDRSEVYIANTVKCRPPENRAPKPEETAACWAYLDGQLHAVRPKVLAPLGNVPLKLFQSKLCLDEMDAGELRGVATSVEYEGQALTLFPLYHPAATLHNPPLRPKVEACYKALGDHLAKMRG